MGVPVLLPSPSVFPYVSCVRGYCDDVVDGNVPGSLGLKRKARSADKWPGEREGGFCVPLSRRHIEEEGDSPKCKVRKNREESGEK